MVALNTSRGSVGRFLRKKASGRVPKIWVADRVCFSQWNWYVLLVLPFLVMSFMPLHLKQNISLVVENSLRADNSLLSSRSNLLSLGVEAQARLNLARDSISHSAWTFLKLRKPPSDESESLDSEKDSSGSGSLSESERIGIFLGGAGSDSGGGSDIPCLANTETQEPTQEAD